MDTDLDRVDPELGPSRPSLHMRSLSGLGGSTIAGYLSSRQSTYITESAIEEKTSHDGGCRDIRTPTSGRVESENLSDNDSLTSQTPYSSPSSKFWGLYLSQAERVDKEQSDSWTANTDGVLVFSGLFSGVLATFLVVSYPLLQPDSTNTQSNGTGSSQPAPANDSSFQAPAFAVRVNSLWFTSLATTTACALWATLMQQWARRYVQVADRQYAPRIRARIRTIFAHGTENFRLAAAVEVLPALLHASFLLFYAGLVEFLININHTVAYILLALVIVGLLVYFILTIMPLLYPDSPYQTPLTSLCWFFMEATPLLRLWLRRRNETVRTAIRDRQIKIGQGMRRSLASKAIELTSQAEADINALLWTLRYIDEDDELQAFLNGLPGLHHVDALHHLAELREGLEELVKPVAFKPFLTTGLLTEGLRRQRLTAYLGGIWCFYSTIDRHFWAIWEQWDKVTNDPWGPLSTETWTVASNMTTDSDPFMAIRAHCVQALMAVMWKRGRWQCPSPEATAHLDRQLGASSVDIERWNTSGDQLQLAVAANLLSKSLPLLEKLETGADATLKIELQAILDRICRELDASEVPRELRARFVDSAEVMKMLNIQDVAGRSPRHAAFDLSGPWTKIFKGGGGWCSGWLHHSYCIPPVPG